MMLDRCGEVNGAASSPHAVLEWLTFQKTTRKAQGRVYNQSVTPSLALPLPKHPLALVIALSMVSAVALGLTRFSYGILLPVMRQDLELSYLVAGAVNTANAVGYLFGALAAPMLLRRLESTHVLIGAMLASVASMACTGFTTAVAAIMVLRAAAGISSAVAFIAGGLMAARLANASPRSAGLFLGIYYGGTGFGIALSAAVVSGVLVATRALPHGWTWAWWALALCCAIALRVVVWATGSMRDTDTGQSKGPQGRPRAQVWRLFGWALAAYFMFGVGNIGYMTFVIALMREQGVAPGIIAMFYGLLGCAAMAAPRIWSGLLDRFKGGQPIAVLTALLGVATILPALTAAAPLVLLSGALFGGVFLAVVAATTALVRHNLASAQWPAGIAAFTVVFAAGQIIGPSLVGWIGDGPGGLPRGFVFSAAALWVGTALALMQGSRIPARANRHA